MSLLLKHAAVWITLPHHLTPLVCKHCTINSNKNLKDARFLLYNARLNSNHNKNRMGDLLTQLQDEVYMMSELFGVSVGVLQRDAPALPLMEPIDPERSARREEFVKTAKGILITENCTRDYLPSSSPSNSLPLFCSFFNTSSFSTSLSTCHSLP